ncbi:hypothetical protein FGG08_004693 [Glutinoglossum americanum]|uniref:Decapping nuclease n=1 Tax=Glutinoglossum americanum TaxID=1670608 RepID=A0A9P8L290_9PEZI|nr:hypothetical protein FGG08_004693 [Glutinoglossum americanum]
MDNFEIHPVERFAGSSAAIRRPKEIACFSYDGQHKFRLDESSLRYYYPPRIGADLSKGFDTFEKLDDTADDHLDSLLATVMALEKETVYSTASTRESVSGSYEFLGFVIMNLHLVMVDLTVLPGYKFETLSLIPEPWDATSRDYIEGREDQIVNNSAQYCSVVRTGIGKSKLVIGGEVDAAWDCKPENREDPINWVELKTSEEILHPRDRYKFERKLLKFWAQSFLLGVPKIIVGFRSKDGILKSIEELETRSIPAIVKRGSRIWDGNLCINFTAEFLEWLKGAIRGDGIWRIRRREKSPIIEVFRLEESGHGGILTQEFVEWRQKLVSNGG